MRTPLSSRSPISSGGLVAEGVDGRILGVTVVMVMSPGRSGSAALDQQGDTLATADAQGDQAVAAAGTFEFGQCLDDQDGAGGAHRVAEAHGAAVGIELVGRE